MAVWCSTKIAIVHIALDLRFWIAAMFTRKATTEAMATSIASRARRAVCRATPTRVFVHFQAEIP